MQLNPHLAPNEPHQLPMKVRSLLDNEYKFFRGTADLFYLFCKEHCSDWMERPENWTWIHGDVHIGNVGAYQSVGPPGADIHFGLVDPDETVRGPFQLDLLRAATALRFALDSTGTEIGERQMLDALDAMCQAYAEGLRGDFVYGDLVARYSIVGSTMRVAAAGRMPEYLAKRVHLRTNRFNRTRVKKGSVKDLMEPVTAELRAQIVGALWECIRGGGEHDSRRRFRFANRAELGVGTLDVARWTRLGSSGSQGLQKYLVLLDRPLVDYSGPIIIQLKEQFPPAAVRSGLLDAGAGGNRASEIVDICERLLTAPMLLLGHTRIGKRAFLVTTKDPWQEDLSEDPIRDVASLQEYAALLGHVVGLAHRQGLLDSAEGSAVVSAIRAQLDDLPLVVLVRSAQAHLAIGDAFRSLSADPMAQELAAAAEAYIERSANVALSADRKLDLKKGTDCRGVTPVGPRTTGCGN